jgi:PAS domain-containing protein
LAQQGPKDWLIKTVEAVEATAVHSLDHEESETTRENLRLTLEELRVVAEELRFQNEQIEEQRRFYEEFIDLLRDACFVTDSRGNIEWANRAARTLLVRDTAAGVPLGIFIAEGHRKRFTERWKALRHLPSGKTLEWDSALDVEGVVRVRLVVSGIEDPKLGRYGRRWIVAAYPIEPRAEN